MARKSRKNQAETLNTAVYTRVAYNAAIYTRLSVEDNNIADGNSIESQKEMLVDYVTEQEDMSLFAVYCDNGFTGTNFERDDFSRMMDDIKDGKINCVVVKDLSRFSRNYIEAGNYIERIFPFMGVRFVSVNDGYDSDKNSTGDIMVTLRNIVNDAYVKDISGKIKSMFETKQNNGDFIGWSAPYGYLKSEDNHNRLVIDPETAPTVVQIFQWKADGIGFATISRKLNEMGIPSPRQRNINMGRYKNPPTDGLFWSDASVSTIIKNPVYAGHMAQRKYTRTSINGKQKVLDSSDWVIVRNTHEAIISEELWDTAQAVTQKNADSYGVNFRKRRTDKGDNLLKGILLCPHCQKTMQQKVDTEKGYNYRYYRCVMQRSNPNCTTPTIKEADIINTVFEVIKKEIATAADVQKLLDKLSKSKRHTDNLNRLQEAIRAAKMGVKRNLALKDKLFDAYGDDLITEQEFRQMKDAYVDEADRLTAEAETLEAEYQSLQATHTKKNEHIASFLRFRKAKSLTREMLTELVEKIVVNGIDSYEIVWRFADEYSAVCALAKDGER